MRISKVVAKNPSTPEGLLHTLAKDGSHSMRAMVAANKGCPEAILNTLINDDDLSVRLEVKHNSAFKRMTRRR